MSAWQRVNVYLVWHSKQSSLAPGEKLSVWILHFEDIVTAKVKLTSETQTVLSSSSPHTETFLESNPDKQHERRHWALSSLENDRFSNQAKVSVVKERIILVNLKYKDDLSWTSLRFALDENESVSWGEWHCIAEESDTAWLRRVTLYGWGEWHCMAEESDTVWLRRVTLYGWGEWHCMAEESDIVWLRRVTLHGWEEWHGMAEESDSVWLRRVTLYGWGEWLCMAEESDTAWLRRVTLYGWG
jgi:hypothetical protein